MVVHSLTKTFGVGGAEATDLCEFYASKGYTVRSYPKNK